MGSLTLIEAMTGAKTARFVVTHDHEKVKLTATGLGAEEVAILHKINGGYEQAYDKSGNAIKMTASAPTVVIAAPGKYRADKPTTASASALQLDE